MTKRQTKECWGCGDPFITYRHYDYCRHCAVNNSRYLKPKTKTPMKTKLEKFWDQVDLLAQAKIYQLLTKNLPLPHLKLITEPYTYEDHQQKLTGLFLHQDVDYRTLLTDIENQSADQALPNAESLAEEIALWYCRMVIKALITDLSNYSVYDSYHFQNLTTSEN